MRTAPRTDPRMRDYRTGLLPWILASIRLSGYGWQIRGVGIHRFTILAIFAYEIRCFWLLCRSIPSPSTAMWS